VLPLHWPDGPDGLPVPDVTAPVAGHVSVLCQCTLALTVPEAGRLRRLWAAARVSDTPILLPAVADRRAVLARASSDLTLAPWVTVWVKARFDLELLDAAWREGAVPLAPVLRQPAWNLTGFD